MAHLLVIVDLTAMYYIGILGFPIYFSFIDSPYPYFEEPLLSYIHAQKVQGYRLALLVLEDYGCLSAVIRFEL